jgi:hypothetical protein
MPFASLPKKYSSYSFLHHIISKKCQNIFKTGYEECLQGALAIAPWHLPVKEG